MNVPVGVEEELISFVETPPDISQLMVSLITKPKGASILDTGCGRGVFLGSLKSQGYTNLRGIELNRRLCKNLEPKFENIEILNKEFLTWISPIKYDVIIGNPPYAHYNSLPAEIQKTLIDLTQTAESDIYYAFIIKSIDLLNVNGELIYIVPYQFFYNTHAEIVRKKILQNGIIEILIDLDEVRLFKKELPETIIIRFVKTNKNLDKKIQVLRIKDKNAKPKQIFEKAVDALHTRKENELYFYDEKENFQSFEEIWSSYPKIDISKYVKLKEVAFVGVGLVSGFDETFRIKDNEIPAFNDKERALINNFVKAVNCKGYWVDGFKKYILMDENIKDEELFSKDYPSIYNRLYQHKEQMAERYMPSSKKWFHWQALRNKKKIEKYFDYPKIFVPTLDRSEINRFSIIKERLYPAGDVLTIVPLKIDPFFLLGYLNSDFFRDYYLSHGARKGHRITFTQRIMSNIKIPKFKNKTQERISGLTKEIIKKRDITIRKRIDKIIKSSLKEL